MTFKILLLKPISAGTYAADAKGTLSLTFPKQSFHHYYNYDDTINLILIQTCDKNQTPAVIHGFIWRLRRWMQAHATRPGIQSKMHILKWKDCRCLVHAALLRVCATVCMWADLFMRIITVHHYRNFSTCEAAFTCNVCVCLFFSNPPVEILCRNVSPAKASGVGQPLSHILPFLWDCHRM